MNSIKRVWLVAIAYWVIVSVSVCLLYPIMVYDPTARYAPMADAFARYDWSLAYHPRFGVLFTTLTGCLSLISGLSGDRACQVVSIAFLAFSAIPVWSLARRIWNDGKIAWIAVVLVWTATEYFVYAEDGLRDTVRIFGLACCALTLVGGSVFGLTIGLFSLVTLRTDLVIISAVVLFAWWCLVLVRIRRDSFSRSTLVQLAMPTLSWALGASLMCLMTHAYTGYWLPGTQFVQLYLKLTGGAL